MGEGVLSSLMVALFGGGEEGCCGDLYISVLSILLGPNPCDCHWCPHGGEEESFLGGVPEML